MKAWAGRYRRGCRRRRRRRHRRTRRGAHTHLARRASQRGRPRLQASDAARRNGYAPCTRRPPAGRCPHRPRSGHGRQGRHSKEGARLVLRGAAKRGACRDASANATRKRVLPAAVRWPFNHLADRDTHKRRGGVQGGGAGKAGRRGGTGGQGYLRSSPLRPPQPVPPPSSHPPRRSSPRVRPRRRGAPPPFAAVSGCSLALVDAAKVPAGTGDAPNRV